MSNNKPAPRAGFCFYKHHPLLHGTGMRGPASEPNLPYFNLAARRSFLLAPLWGLALATLRAPAARGASPRLRRGELTVRVWVFLPLPVQFHSFLGDRVRAPPVQTKLHFLSSSALLFTRCCWCSLCLSLLSFFPARLSLVLRWR